MLIEILLIALGFGLPLTVLTWYLFKRLYDSGELDRSLDRRALRPQLKALKRASKKAETRDTHLIHSRWMRFGGGFYGLAALWTFVVIEVTDAARFVWNFPGFAELFKDGLVGFVASALVNQLQNFLTALVWFANWGRDGSDVIAAVVIAYLAYLLGMRLAREDITPGMEGLKAFFTGSRDSEP
jgi:hypothetical protein